MNPQREAALSEAYKRGLLPQELKTAYEEALKRGLVKGEKGFVGRTVDKVVSAVTGRDRREPGVGEYTTEFGDTGGVGGDLKTAAGMLLSATPEQQAGILKNNLPNAEFRTDEYGNHLVKKEGGDWEYINRPGLSMRDIANTVAQGAALFGPAKGALALSGAKSLPVKAAITGLSAGAGSIGLDKVSDLAGSEQGVSLPRAAVSTVAGGALELTAPVLAGAWRMITKGGKVDKEVARKFIAKTLKTEIKDVTDDVVDNFIATARKAANPKDAAALAEANSLPVKVPLTTGKITGRAQDQMLEDLMEKGAYGEASESLMRGANKRTEDALLQNVSAISENIGGGTARGESGAMAQQAVQSKAKAFKGKVDAAYTAARDTTGTMPDDYAVKMASEIEQSIYDFLPHSKMAPAEVDKLLSVVTGGDSVSIKALYDWRRSVSTLANNAKDRTEAAALNKLKRQFDESIDKAMTEVLQNGDEAAIKSWKKAIALRKGYGKVFEQKDLISDLIEKKKGTYRLKVDPSNASNEIFGYSNAKLLSRPELAQSLKKLKTVLGPKSKEWLAVKEEAFLRLTQRATSGEGFSGAKFMTDLKKMRRENPVLWKSLFTEEERVLINRLASVAHRATVPVKGGSNFSNTSVGVARLVQSLSDALFMGKRGQAVLSRIFPNIYSGVQMGSAAKAAAGKIPVKQIPQGLTGAAGATGFRQNYVNQ